MRHITALFALGLILSSCSSDDTEDFRLRRIRLPNGDRILAEPLMNREDMVRGMMFRDKLEPGRGMLFQHAQPGRYGYWMFQVRIPLDIIWMDENHRIVEIVANAKPCMTRNSRECPSYGGNRYAQFVLELAGGEAARRALKVGDVLTW